MAGDADCFGLAASCPDGSLWQSGLGGAFWTSSQGAGDAPFTDVWNDFVDPSFSLANPGGGAVTLVTRIAGVADQRGPWNVWVNGFQVGVIPTNNDPNAYQEVLTYKFLVPNADLLAVNNIVLGINHGALTDGYDIDYVALTSGGVPEPMTWALMLTGFAGMGLALRRRRLAHA